jgi:hypothetical protein
MDIDAALKDGYSIAEVNAEAARRVNFNYAGAIKDGYSDQEVLEELRKRTAKPAEPGLIEKGLSSAGQLAKDTGGAFTALGDVLYGIPNGIVGLAATGMA